MKVGSDGTFLVRERDGESYALTVIFKGKATHHLASKDATSGMWLVGKKKYGDFATLGSLINGLSEGKGSGWPVQLGCVDTLYFNYGLYDSYICFVYLLRPPILTTSIEEEDDDNEPESKPEPTPTEQQETHEPAAEVVEEDAARVPSDTPVASGVGKFPIWLHGQLSKRTAQEILIQGGSEDGTFFVWEREASNEYGLSVMFKGRPTHHLVIVLI